MANNERTGLESRSLAVAKRAHRMVRKMRGGTQPVLIEVEDGEFYVVKFINNPQHRRVLVNEWLANAFLRHLEICVPKTTVIRVTQAFISENPELHFSVGSNRRLPEPGQHFGSRLEVDPEKVAIFDLLPNRMLGHVENLSDFLGTLVFDQWAGNTDSRQAVFFRGRRSSAPYKEEGLSPKGFFAQMIDHGLSFNGEHWRFVDSVTNGLYHARAVYNNITSLYSFQPWLDRVAVFPEEVMRIALRELPCEWIDSDSARLADLMEMLFKRRARVPQLIEQIHRQGAGIFTNWR